MWWAVKVTNSVSGCAMWGSNSMEKFKMMKLANHAVLKLLILFFSLVSSISIAQAAYQRSYLNFDFESNFL